MMKRIVVVLVLLLICPPAYADEASHRKACEDLLKMMNVDKMMAPMYGQIKRTQMESMKNINIPEDMKDISDRYFERMNDLLKKEMSWDNLKGDFVNVYIEVFSESEVNEIIGFYNSPIGKKLVERSPILMQKSMEISQKKVVKLMPEIEKLSSDMREEIRQRKMKK